MFGLRKVDMKIYKNAREFEKDGAKMIKRGYEIKHASTKDGDVNLGRTGAQFVLGNMVFPGVGFLWAFGKPSRQDDAITVIWELEAKNADKG
jgi:hypothetical protein